MAEQLPLKIAFAGCGNISGPYAQSVMQHTDRLKIVGAYDLEVERAKQFVERFGGRAFESLEEMVNSPEVEAVVNLTIHTAHAEVTHQALEAGKHVHSEKPLATEREEGTALVKLAEESGLLLGCSPFVILGEAQQTLWKCVREGMAGEVLEVIAEMMHGRIESWHPNPAPFYGYGAGPLLDVGCYPLNVLTSILGPVRSVRGAAKIRIPERKIASGPQAGRTFSVTTPDHVIGLLDFANGVGGRLTASFVVGKTIHTGIEIHGTKGSLLMTSPVAFNAEVKFCPIEEKEWREVPLVADPYKGVEWCRGLLDMADAIHNNRPLRCTGAQANHILDISLGILEAAESGNVKYLDTTFQQPEPIYK